MKEFNSENLSKSIKEISDNDEYKLVGLFDDFIAEFYVRNGVCMMAVMDERGDKTSLTTNPPTHYSLLTIPS